VSINDVDQERMVVRRAFSAARARPWSSAARLDGVRRGGVEAPAMSTSLAGGTAEITFREFSDPAELEAFYVGQYSARIRLGQPPPGTPAVMSAHRLKLAALEITEQRRYVEMATQSERDDAYVVCLSAVGELFFEQRRVEIAATADRGAVYQPAAGPVLVRTPATSTTRALIVAKWTLVAQLELLLDRPISAALMLEPALDLHTATGRSWLRLLTLLTGAMHESDPNHAFLRPVIGEPLCQALLTGLLLTANHRYADELARPAAACRPRHVQIAIDLIRAHPEQPHTTASLARAAGISVRNLQQGFRQHLRTSPMAYLRHVRLTHAHDDLQSGRVTTVAAAAHRWGLTHLGRFAAAHRAKYGTLPSALTRRA
jgi:AraC-like DNA-binding protein